MEHNTKEYNSLESMVDGNTLPIVVFATRVFIAIVAVVVIHYLLWVTKLHNLKRKRGTTRVQMPADTVEEELEEVKEQSHLPLAAPLTCEEQTKVESVVRKSKPQLVERMAAVKQMSKAKPTMQEFQKRESSAPFKEALAYTQQLVSDESLEVGKSVPIKLFSAMFADIGMDTAFFDSSDAKMNDLRDDMCSVSALLGATDNAETGFDLKLESLAGLLSASDEVTEDTKEESDSELLVRLQACIESNVAHPILQTVRRKLAIAHGIENWQRVRIIAVYCGSDNFKYTVDDLEQSEINKLKDDARTGKTVQNLKNEFSNFKSARIHPLFYRPCFDVNNFDGRGHKVFGSSSTFSIGPTAALKEAYVQPKGWTRYGLKVLGTYNDDSWLHPFDESRIWWKAYHGTGRAKRVGFDTADAAHNISKGTGFIVSGTVANTTAAYGAGVYCSPKLDFVCSGYSATKTLKFKGTSKKFEFVLMCAVKPTVAGVKKSGDIWVVKSPSDIRPYGILVREK